MFADKGIDPLQGSGVAGGKEVDAGFGIGGRKAALLHHGERLAGDDAPLRVMAGGLRASDVQVRLKYAGIHATLAGSVEEAYAQVADLAKDVPLYVLTNYSALWPAKEELERMGESHE